MDECMCVHPYNLLLLLDDVGELRVGDAGIQLTLHQCCPLVVLDVAQVAALGHLDVLGEALGSGSQCISQTFPTLTDPLQERVRSSACHVPSPQFRNPVWRSSAECFALGRLNLSLKRFQVNTPS